jgi:hypothetical protein
LKADMGGDPPRLLVCHVLGVQYWYQVVALCVYSERRYCERRTVGILLVNFPGTFLVLT